jgi:uncharacterized membrane protein
MVQGHSLDVLLAPSHRAGAFFSTWMFLRGITAPMFLVLAGVAFSIVTARRWDAYLHYSPEMRRRIFRFSSLIFFGYAMHSPVRSPFDIPGLSAESWQSWSQVDVLQCIGVTLLTIQLLILVLRTPARLAAVVGALAVSIALITPLTWHPALTGHFPPFIAAYLNGLSGSVFPLFPWAAYICAGVWLGHWYLHRKTAQVPLLLGGGLGLIVLGFALEKPMSLLFDNFALWRTSPNIFILKVGCVCVFLAAINLVTRHVSFPRRPTQALAQESLPVYLLHLAVLYGSAWNLGLRQYVGDTLGVRATLLWVSLLLVSMTLFAIGWNWLKKGLRDARHAQPSRVPPTATPERAALVTARLSEASGD